MVELTLTVFTLCRARLSVSCEPQRNHAEGCDQCLAHGMWMVLTKDSEEGHHFGMVQKVSWGWGRHLYEGREDRVRLVGPGPRRVYGQGAQSREAPKAS